MPWQQLRFEIASDQAMLWSEALEAIGALSVDIADADGGSPDESPIFGEPGELFSSGSPAPALWKKNLVSALFQQNIDLVQSMTQLAGILQQPLPIYSIDSVEEQDWVRLTQAQFKPIAIEERLWIVPSWHQPVNPQAINLRLDPGVAFGTGSHPTTRLCLRWLVQNIRGQERLLDYGCGSGILAIAAAKLGAVQVMGVDIDPQAITAAADNAQRNEVVVEWFCNASSVVPQERLMGHFDILVANILTNPLKALAGELAQYVKPGGKIVLSGILTDQVTGEHGVQRAYSPWFPSLQVWGTEEGWVCLEGVRL